MPRIDLTVTISVIIALCAILSPIITSIINNRHQLKIKKLELQEKRCENTIFYQRTIFENYLKYSGECITSANSEAFRKYGEYYLIALMYVPDDMRNKMIEANTMMKLKDWSGAQIIYEELAPMLCSLLQHM